MRPVLLILLAALVLAAPARSRAGSVVVDPLAMQVSTSRLIVVFDATYPDLIDGIAFRDFDSTVSLCTYTAYEGEFWGQSYRNGGERGFIWPRGQVAHSWQVTQSSPRFARIVTSSTSADNPPVVTTYTFFADQPYFTVDRTIQFSARPETTSYEAYLPRLIFLEAYRALRWRTIGGGVIQRGFCSFACEESDWDGRWLQQYQRSGPVTAIALNSIFPSSTPPGTTIARGWGPFSSSGWVAPVKARAWHSTDETSRQMLAFSLAPDDFASIDALWTLYNNGQYLADVPPAEPAAPLRMSARPNPAAGPVSLEWSSPVAGRARIEILDVGGRRVATVFDGPAGSGGHAVVWNGRDASGPVAPGVYFACLATPAGRATVRIARAH